MKRGAERRRAARRPFEGTVELMEEVRGQWGTGMARDISALGMFLQTLSDYRVGDHVVVRFMLPTTSCQVELKGSVVRVEGPGHSPAARPGVAIVFADAPDWAADEVRRYVLKGGRRPVGGVVKVEDD